MQKTNIYFNRREQGVALAVALILLVVITLLALSGVRLSTMELRMSLNDELRVSAFEQAQSLVDGTVRKFSNTPILAPGVTRCAKAINNVCTTATLVLPSYYANDIAAGYANALIESIPPLNAEPPVGTGFSVPKFDAAYMQVSGIFDRNSQGLGQTTIKEGIAIVYGSAGDIQTATGAGALTALDGP